MAPGELQRPASLPAGEACVPASSPLLQPASIQLLLLTPASCLAPFPWPPTTLQANVTLDGKPLIRQQFNFWQHTAPLGAKDTHELVFTSVNGKLASAEVPRSMLLGEGLRDLKIQFDP